MVLFFLLALLVLLAAFGVLVRWMGAPLRGLRVMLARVGRLVGRE